jgi:hypothetical protein
MLTTNSTLTELDVSDNWKGAGSGGPAKFAKELAVGLCDNGALSMLFMRQNNIHGAEAGKAFAVMLPQNTVLKELDLSSQKTDGYGDALDAAFTKEFAVGISDNGALSVLSLKNNSLGQENDRGGMQALSDMLKGNTVLTDLDMSENYMDATDAKIFSEGISDNGALTKFDISNCGLRAEGGKALAVGLKGNHVMTELNVAGNELGIQAGGTAYDTSGIIAIAYAIPNMRAMTSLNLANNNIGEIVLAAGWRSRDVMMATHLGLVQMDCFR